MKAAIYNPYLDSLGGGERYTMAFAKVVQDLGYKVDIEWKDKSISEKFKDRFGIETKDMNFISSIKKGEGYDICFWLSDGSIPLLKARNNIIHFQYPFQKVNGKSIINKAKFFRINHIICNSEFTKSFIDREYGVKSKVVYPPVDVKKFKPGKKENLVVYVGRFSQLTQSKNQHELVSVFKKFFDAGNRDWKMVLAGGTDVGVDDYVDILKNESTGYPIRILENPNFKVLTTLYSKAKLFWSAAGFGADEQETPLKVEHFGITVVEAMASGCVPIIYKAGGYKEIVDHGKNGFFWLNTSRLLAITKNLNHNPKLLLKVSKEAKLRANKFSDEHFKTSIQKILN